MSNYTGPVTVVRFVGPRDLQVITFHTNETTEERAAAITDRLAEDGYKPDLNTVKQLYMVNGSLVPREATEWPKLGFSSRSAFLKG